MNIEKLVNISKRCRVRIRYKNINEIKELLKLIEEKTSLEWADGQKPTQYLPHRSYGHLSLMGGDYLCCDVFDDEAYKRYDHVYWCSEIIPTYKAPSKQSLMDFLQGE